MGIYELISLPVSQGKSGGVREGENLHAET